MPDLHSTKILGDLKVTGDTQGIKTVKEDNTGSETKIWVGTQAQYNAITTKDPNTLYHITA